MALAFRRRLIYLKIFMDTYNTALQAKSGGVNIKTMSIYKNLEKKGLNVRLYNKYVDKIEECDILFIISPEYEHYSLVNYAKKRNVKVIVSSVKNMDFKIKKKISYYLGKINLKNFDYITGEILRMSDSVISETKIEKIFLEKYYNVKKEKINVIPNGVDDIKSMKYSDAIYSKIGLLGDYALCVGRFDENKNQLSLIRALKNTNIPLVFIGGSVAESKEYYEQCLKEASKNMFFLDWIKHNSEIFISAYQNAKVVTLPSKYEIFGNSLIEGGMSGSNLVTTNALPIEEWGLNDICLKMDVNNLEDIRKKITLAFYNEKSDIVYNLVKKQFSWESITQKHIELLERVFYENNKKDILDI